MDLILIIFEKFSYFKMDYWKIFYCLVSTSLAVLSILNITLAITFVLQRLDGFVIFFRTPSVR
jgi:hypothetical protein